MRKLKLKKLLHSSPHPHSRHTIGDQKLPEAQKGAPHRTRLFTSLVLFVEYCLLNDTKPWLCLGKGAPPLEHPDGHARIHSFYWIHSFYCFFPHP